MPPKRSLSLKYTSVPPALAVWRALQSRHFLLVLVCLTTLSVNILTIALSGIFSPRTCNSTTQRSFNRKFEAQLQIPYNGAYYSGFFATESNISDPAAFYVAKSTLSDGGGFPAWTTHDYFFAPFDLDFAVGADFDSYRANTIGYHGFMTCVPVYPNDSFNATPITLNRVTVPKEQQETFPMIISVDAIDHVNITVSNDLGQQTRCFSSWSTFSTTQGVRILGNGSLTGEWFQTMDTYNSSTLTAEERFSCLNTVLFGWVRANGTTSGIYDGLLDSNASASLHSYSMLACRQEMTPILLVSPLINLGTFEITFS